MPNINAALGLAQLLRFDTILNKKKELFKSYSEIFYNTEYDLIKASSNTMTNNWLISIKCKSLADRDKAVEYFNKYGIGARPVWRLLSDLPMYANCPHGDLIESKIVERTLLNLPSSIPTHKFN